MASRHSPLIVSLSNHMSGQAVGCSRKSGGRAQLSEPLLSRDMLRDDADGRRIITEPRADWRMPNEETQGEEL